MNLAAFETGERQVKSAGIIDVNHNTQTRNIWVAYPPHQQLLTFSKPRISECKKFMIEDIASANDPEKVVGVSKTPISDLQISNFKPEEIVKELFRKSEPKILVFD